MSRSVGKRVQGNLVLVDIDMAAEHLFPIMDIDAARLSSFSQVSLSNGYYQDKDNNSQPNTNRVIRWMTLWKHLPLRFRLFRTPTVLAKYRPSGMLSGKLS
jgi:hypothetical protein